MGWEPIGNPANSHWTVKDGLLVNQEHGANLKSVRKFEDFKAHFEVNCPDDGNSGFYLRGRYEVQIEYEPLTSNPPERRIGSIYGRITPKEMPRTPGDWETFDVTLVGRTVTVVRNGVTTIDHQEIEGITGGALDANEGEPGPFYIQGDHTGGLKFRCFVRSQRRDRRGVGAPRCSAAVSIPARSVGERRTCESPGGAHPPYLPASSHSSLVDSRRGSPAAPSEVGGPVKTGGGQDGPQ